MNELPADFGSPPSMGRTREEQLAQDLKFLMGEYRSLINGFAELIDAISRWSENAPEEEGKRCDVLHRQATGVMLQHGIRPVARVGAPFDPKYHEAVEAESNEQLPADSVSRVLQMGYELVLPGNNSLLLRTARVVVSQAPDAAPASQAPDEPAPAPVEPAPAPDEPAPAVQCEPSTESAEPPASAGPSEPDASADQENTSENA